MRAYFLPFVTFILIIAAFLRINALEQYPPGPHYDEAANILITRSIAFDGANLFPIANSYQGRESLYYYINAPLFRLIGDDYFTLKLSSLYLNLMTIAASIGLGRAMFNGRRGYVIGLAVGVLMTFSFHQIFMSRQAFRAVTLPAMQAFGLLFLYRGLRTNRWYWLAIGGVFSAGALYTYMASRLFPVWLAIGGISLLWFDRANWRKRLGQGVIFFGMMLLVALPLILYAVQNPDIFFQRLTEVSEGEVTISLSESIIRHIKMFFIYGDFGNLRYNDPGRPYFTLPEGVLLLAGLAVAFWRIKAVRHPLERSAYVLALFAPLMVIPSVISLAGYPPSNMRSLGMVPLIFVLVAIGFEAISTRFKPRQLLIVGVGALLIGSGFVWRDYMTWAQRDDLFYQADGDLAAAADWLNQNPADVVYISSYHRAHPTILANYDGDVTWLGLDSLFLPPDHQDAVVIFSHDYPPPDDWLPFLQPIEGDTSFWAYRFVDHANVVIPVDAPSNPYLTFVDLTTTPIPAGETGEFSMTWQVDQTPPFYSLRPVMNLKNTDGITVASSDLYLLGTDQWRAGEVMIQRVRFPVPPGTLPGDYTLDVVWVDRNTETFVPYAGGGIQAEIGQISITPSIREFNADVLPAITRQPTTITPEVELIGWNTPPAQARPGEIMTPVIFLQADIGTDLNIDLLLDEHVLRSDEIHVDDPLLTIYLNAALPHDLEAGEYTLAVRINDVVVDLSRLHVEGIPRIFEPFEMDSSFYANFDDIISLEGYTLVVADGTIQIDLMWHALESINQDYKVFVHLINTDGVTIDQRDAMPQNYAYPTSLWIVGEYVLDSYVFSDVPEGDYTLRIGFYMQETGNRLTVKHENTEIIEDFIQILIKHANS